MDFDASRTRDLVRVPAAGVADGGEEVLADVLAALRAAASLDDLEASERLLGGLLQTTPRLARDLVRAGVVRLFKQFLVLLELLALVPLYDDVLQKVVRAARWIVHAGELPAQKIDKS